MIEFDENSKIMQLTDTIIQPGWRGVNRFGYGDGFGGGSGNGRAFYDILIDYSKGADLTYGKVSTQR